MSVPTPILASQSPRRKELLGLILPAFSVQVSDADETLAPGTSPMAAVASEGPRGGCGYRV